MITAWRIVKKKHSASPFDGEGARRYGGRWNSLGTAMVYTFDYLATAALELMVNMIDYSEHHSYLLNPNHRDFSKIKINKPSPFSFDSRLLKP